ncbi:methionyl-tRNA formyltransferase [Helicobacter sp. UBA3407]|uniref:methionyl-tRNA formyltransferase n=1 Tax=Helicobacter TaxID=209 RepID=UPI0026116065|nr:methionyl-tRNA formyltransferase [Helicobacter sp. UBA3407]
MKIVIATLKKWNLKNFKKLQKLYPNLHFVLIQDKEELTQSCIDSINPRFIFFPHWSYRIPQEIYQNYECIVFHMTDLPFGRGGSPLQNLILRGIKRTKISALRVCEVLDGGDIYLKKPLDISKGSAKEIYKLASKKIFFKMIPYIFQNKPQPKAQVGQVVAFKRRVPEQSDLNALQNPTLMRLYDFIRMLDAQSYPRAFLDWNGFRIRLSCARLKKKTLSGRFKCKKS